MAKQKTIDILPIYHEYALGCDYDAIILVGGRNSGKSHFLEQNLVKEVHNKKDYKLACLTDVETNVEAGVKEGLEDMFDEFGYGPLYTDTKKPPKIEYKNGNSILFKGIKTDSHMKKFKEIKKVTATWFEEAENMTYEQFKAMQNQLRGGDPKDRRIYISLNPINPESYINKTFFQTTPDKVYERFENGRKKVFDKFLKVKMDGGIHEIKCRIICTTFEDNPYLTDSQRAAIIEYKQTRPDLWKMLGECKFVWPEGTLIEEYKKFSLSRMDISQFSHIKAVVDTASSGKDSATLGIYGKIDDEHYYLLDAIKNSKGADEAIDEMIPIVNKWEPQELHVEKNHEGLYFKDQFKKRTKPSIFVKDFNSSENKHEKILSQSNKIIHYLYTRDDAGAKYKEFIKETKTYNRDPKKNKGKPDDCIDNESMYFKHVANKGRALGGMF